MNDGLDEMHSDREEGILPTVREIVGLFLLWLASIIWLATILFVAFALVGCLSS